MARRWSAATADEKRKLLAEYDALPDGTGAKDQWRKAHGMASNSTASVMLSYYRQRFRKLDGAGQSKAVVVHRKTADSSALLAQYDALPRDQRAGFLKEHGLYRTWASNTRARERKNGDHVTMLPPPAFEPVVTLDDAINAFEVRQDIMREFIEQLKQMKVVKRG